MHRPTPRPASAPPPARPCCPHQTTSTSLTRPPFRHPPPPAPRTGLPLRVPRPPFGAAHARG
eukprot:scaffold30409_cov59-Phaeocystis_antarctica.AAC.4